MPFAHIELVIAQASQLLDLHLILSQVTELQRAVRGQPGHAAVAELYFCLAIPAGLQARTIQHRHVHHRLLEIGSLPGKQLHRALHEAHARDIRRRILSRRPASSKAKPQQARHMRRPNGSSDMFLIFGCSHGAPPFPGGILNGTPNDFNHLSAQEVSPPGFLSYLFL